MSALLASNAASGGAQAHEHLVHGNGDQRRRLSSAQVGLQVLQRRFVQSISSLWIPDTYEDCCRVRPPRYGDVGTVNLIASKVNDLTPQTAHSYVNVVALGDFDLLLRLWELQRHGTDEWSTRDEEIGRELFENTGLEWRIALTATAAAHGHLEICKALLYRYERVDANVLEACVASGDINVLRTFLVRRPEEESGRALIRRSKPAR